MKRRKPAIDKENNLPLNSVGLTSSNNLSRAENTVKISGGLILSNTIPENSSGGNSKILPKSLSNVIITLSSELLNLAISLSSEPRGTVQHQNLYSLITLLIYVEYSRRKEAGIY